MIILFLQEEEILAEKLQAYPVYMTKKEKDSA